MKILVTGSAGHLGEALVRSLREQGHEVAGLDILASPFTTRLGSIADRASVRRAMAGVRWGSRPSSIPARPASSATP
jgi:nucleoside-diphosphate-sugar epimerase